MFLEVVPRADADSVAMHIGSDAVPDQKAHFLVADMGEVTAAGEIDHGAGDGMARMFGERSHQRQEFLLLQARAGGAVNVCDLKGVVCERARLVEDNRIDGGECFERLPAFDQASPLGRPVHRRLDGDRRAELYCARIVDEEDRLQPPPVAREREDRAAGRKRKQNALVGEAMRTRFECRSDRRVPSRM